MFERYIPFCIIDCFLRLRHIPKKYLEYTEMGAQIAVRGHAPSRSDGTERASSVNELYSTHLYSAKA